MSARLRVLGLAGASLALAGCTLVPTTTKPITISPKSVPYGLLGTSHGQIHFVTQPVYIVDATGHLAPSSRIVPEPATLASVLRELVIGPTSIEAATGYTNAIPKDLVILQATVQKGVGYISLPAPLSHLGTHQQVLAMGQLAFTASEVGARKGIEILVAGIAQPSLLPNGETAALVTAQDYASLLNS